MTKEQIRQEIAVSDVIHFGGHARFSVTDRWLPISSSVATGSPYARFRAGRPALRIIVLSACDSSYLGASSNVSLWLVNNQPTVELMKAFYAQCIEARRPKVDALREAQRHVHAEFNGDPYHWAPFVLIGDWL